MPFATYLRTSNFIMPLSVVQAPTHCNHFISPASRQNSSNMVGHIFSSFKSKISRKNSEKASFDPNASIPIPKRSSNPFLQTMAPTRRPGGFSEPDWTRVNANKSSDRNGMNAFTTPSNEPPPAYESSTPAAARIAGATVGSDNDPYAFLSQFDTIFIIDDSGSMVGRNWRETQKALEAITPICTSHDADGIDLYFLNAPDSPWYQNVKSSATVAEIFSSVRPTGQTFLGRSLHKVLKPYMQRYERNPDTTTPMNIIVITDGEPSDDPETVIINAAKKLDKLDAPAWQVGIQFFQVGREPGAQAYLKQLDDSLDQIAGEELRDMVDTQAWTNANNEELNAEGILKTVLGGVNKRLDRRRSKDLFATK